MARPCRMRGQSEVTSLRAFQPSGVESEFDGLLKIAYLRGEENLHHPAPNYFALIRRWRATFPPEGRLIYALPKFYRVRLNKGRKPIKLFQYAEALFIVYELPKVSFHQEERKLAALCFYLFRSHPSLTRHLPSRGKAIAKPATRCFYLFRSHPSPCGDTFPPEGRLPLRSASVLQSALEYWYVQK